MGSQPRLNLSRRIGRFRWDRTAIGLLCLLAMLAGAHGWLLLHPEHDPRAPLDLDHPVGWATQAKLDALQGNPGICRDVLDRSNIAFSALPSAGEGACLRQDRTRLADFPLSPDVPPVSCPTAVALVLWQRDTVQPAAQSIFGQDVASIGHLGAFSCRRLYGRSTGPWSEHATANAIDIAGFTLADGTQISVLRDWDSAGKKARFLRRVRDGACESFATTLSPDYNAAHADHFHLDQQARSWGRVCR